MIPILGTALWGWSVDQTQAWDLLDTFVAAGGIWIDSAVNYPINGDLGVHRSAVILNGWLRANPRNALRVWYKIGALNNSGAKDTMLDRASVLTAARLAEAHFAGHLGCLGIHWDNRGEVEAIRETVDTLHRVSCSEKMPIGLSGLNHPDLYARVISDINVDTTLWVQVKENALTHAARDHYAVFEQAYFFAYGINMGGVKTIAENLKAGSLALRGIREPTKAAALREFLGSEAAQSMGIRTLNQLALHLLSARREVRGVVLGARTVQQLTDSLDILARLREAPLDDMQCSILRELAP